MGELGAQKSLAEKPYIFSYHDYREYLREQFDWLSSNQPNFSVSKACKAAKVAPSLVTMILKDGKTLTDKTIDKLAPFIRVDGEEADFLKLLVKLSDSEAQAEKERAFAQIKKNSKYKKANPTEVVTHEYLNSWLYPAIRELAQLDDFQFDAWWVKSRLRIKTSITEIRDALYFLLNNKFLEYDELGKIKKPDKPIHCQAGIYRLSIAEYYKQTLALAGDAPHNSLREERKMSGHTVAIGEKDVESVRQILKEAEDKIIALSESNKNADRVYQISLVSFPLSSAPKKEAS